MSNVKRVLIEGTLPFDCYEDKDMQGYLALLNGPCVGIRIDWSDDVVEMRDNVHGGRTAFYGFRITGKEALAWGWFDAFYEAVRNLGGIIKRQEVVDIEG
jgi:hypothetical protein